MNAAPKQPEIIGIDRAAGRDGTVFTFICADCERTEHSTVACLPQGWDMCPVDCSGAQVIRCPDCNEAIEQAKFAQMQGRLVDFHNRPPVGDECPCFTCTVDGIGIHPAQPKKPASDRPFSIWLERNQGEYLVAMTPETALMRISPLGFFLSAEGARRFAWELLKFAGLAAAPGTLPDRIGEAK